mgnify:CR=1 FL=1
MYLELLKKIAEQILPGAFGAYSAEMKKREEMLKDKRYAECEKNCLKMPIGFTRGSCIKACKEEYQSRSHK